MDPENFDTGTLINLSEIYIYHAPNNKNLELGVILSKLCDRTCKHIVLILQIRIPVLLFALLYYGSGRMLEEKKMLFFKKLCRKNL